MGGLAGAALSYTAARSLEPLGWPMLLVVVALLVLVPSAASLARRVALNGSILLGWTQVTWWVDWPVHVDHAAVLVALTVGGVTSSVMASGDRRGWCHRLRPTTTAVDSLLLCAPLVAVVALRRWVNPSSPRDALVAMLPGADNYAHFHMFATLRTYGATTHALGQSPDGSAWGFDVYPQGFHALVATVSELTGTGRSAGLGLLSAYTQGVGILLALCLSVLTAAMLSLPGMARRPLATTTAVVLTWVVFLWRPGQDLLADGFANFWLAAGVVAIGLLVAIAPQRRLALPETLAVGGLLVLAAHAWAPLVLLMAPAMLVLLHPWRGIWRELGRSRRGGATLAVLTVSAGGVLVALAGLLRGVAVKEVVTAPGGIHGSPPLPAFLLLVVGCVVMWTAPTVLRHAGAATRAQEAAARARILLLTPAIGVSLAAVLLVAQLRTIGTSSYYFLKLFMGLELILAGIVPAICVMVLAAAPSWRGSRRWSLLAPAGVALVATLTLGLLSSPPPLDDRGRGGTASVTGRYDVERMADGIVSAVRAARTDQSGFGVDYLALGPDRAAEAFYPDGWFHGATASLSTRVQERVDILRTRVDGPDEAASVARELLSKDPDARLLVAPDHARRLRALLGSPLSERVLTW